MTKHVRNLSNGFLGSKSRALPLFLLGIGLWATQSLWAAGDPPLPGTELTIDNVRNNGIVHSGFLVGTAAGNKTVTTLIEVSLDGQIFKPAEGTSNWKVRLPHGTPAWRENSTHTIQVRATDSTGGHTLSPVLSVRVGLNHDVDGDGFADVLAGDPAFDNDRGRVYLFYSADDKSGIPSTEDANNLDDPEVKVIGGAFEGPQSFGKGVAMADVNGDGYADLIVGAPSGIGGAGRLYVFLAIEVAPGHALIVQGNAIDTGFGLSGDTGRLLGLGTSVAAGDVNGDGFADLIAGAPGTAGTPAGEGGRVYIFHANSPLNPATVFGADTTVVAEVAGSGFGAAVAAGDVNGDLFDDLVVGANLFGGITGRAYVFHAAADGSGIPTTFDDTSGVRATSADAADTQIAGEETSRFGSSLTLGDFNSDGFADLAVGGPTFGNADNGGDNRGRTYLFYSAGATGIPTNPVIDPTNQTAGQHVIGGTLGSGEQFGVSLANGDVNADGTTDLIVGAPAGLDGLGIVYVFHGVAGTGFIIGNAHSATDNGTEIDSDQQSRATLAFGSSVAAGDVNGDAVLDVLAGASGDAAHAGRAFVFNATASQNGTGGGIPVGRTIRGASTSITGAAGTSFGASIE